MIIECEILNQPRTCFVSSTWSHSPLDPLAVVVKFGLEGPVWTFSLDLLMETFTDPDEGLHGSGDVLMEVGKNFTNIYLSNGPESAALRFSSADIREFLNRVDYGDWQEVISRELDDFLETL